MRSLLRILRPTAAAATVVLLAVMIFSVWACVFIWTPGTRFYGLQHGRIGWGEHSKKHGEFRVYVSRRPADLDWVSSGTPPRVGMRVGGGFGPGGGWNRWVPIWPALAGAAGVWTVLLVCRRRHKPGCCVGCGYDLAGVPAGEGGVKCPECGAKA